MTAPSAQGPRVGRWAAVALVCAALAFWPALAFWAPPGTRAGRAAQAATFDEYLALRARPPVDEPDPLRPLLASNSIPPRAASLLFASVIDDHVRLDNVVGPLPRALEGLLVEPSEAASMPDAPSARVALLGCDEAGLAPGLDAALATTLGLPLLSGAARGQSPLGHVGLFARASTRRVAAFVSVWNLANDLGETELLRRLYTYLEPSGPCDAFLAALRDPVRAAAAQEAWFAARADAARDVVAVLGGIGFELERHARLHGARLVVVLLRPDAQGGGPEAPCTGYMAEGVERALRERGVRVVTIPGEGGLRDAAGRLTAQGVAQVVACVRAAIG